MLKLKPQFFGHLMQSTDSFEKTWCWERLNVGGEGDDRGWDDLMASPTQWTWVWVNSRSCWWTGKPAMLQSMASQIVRHDWATELTDEPNILGSYVILFFTALDFTFTTRHFHTGCCFHFGQPLHSFWSISHFSPIAYWVPTDLGSSSFSVIYFCHFILFMAFSRQECWSSLPFPSSIDHVLSELSTMTRPSWVALYGLAHSSSELIKAVIHVISLFSFLWLWFSFCLPSWWMQ